ncbi:MAG: DUF1499 domain-containing protein [Arenicellales bacterium]
MSRTAGSVSALAATGLVLALAAAGAAALAGPAYRFHVLPLRDAFALLRWAAYGGGAAAAVSILGLVVRTRPGGPHKGLWAALAGLILGATVFWLPFSQMRAAGSVPPIHDITTDTVNPPEFRAVVPLRPKGANSLAYGGDALARQQHEAYPNIRPATFDVAPKVVFAAALEVARGMGWRIVDSAPGQGRIEAVATTFWFGFKDDVVVRVAGAGPGTRVDVRSVSRVGVSDVGTNARRIRKFLARLRSKIDAERASRP